MYNYSIEIPSLDESRMALASARQDKLLKPIGALGALETISVRLAGIISDQSRDISKTAIAVFAADNNIHDENVSPVPQAVTAAQSVNMIKGTTRYCVIQQHDNE